MPGAYPSIQRKKKVKLSSAELHFVLLRQNLITIYPSLGFPTFFWQNSLCSLQIHCISRELFPHHCTGHIISTHIWYTLPSIFLWTTSFHHSCWCKARRIFTETKGGPRHSSLTQLQPVCINSELVVQGMFCAFLDCNVLILAANFWNSGAEMYQIFGKYAQNPNTQKAYRLTKSHPLMHCDKSQPLWLPGYYSKAYEIRVLPKMTMTNITRGKTVFFLGSVS